MYKLWIVDLVHGAFSVTGEYQDLLNLLRILSRHYHKDNFTLCRSDGTQVIIPR